MQFSASTALALFAAVAMAAPADTVAQLTEREAIAMRSDSTNLIQARCDANLPICGGATYIGDDSCKCGQKAPCGDWKCGWTGARSIVSFPL